MLKKSLAIATVSLLTVGCASQPNKIQASYVSPIQYKNHDCEMIAAELDMVTRRANQLYTSLKKEADADAAQMAVGLVLFWPTLLMLEGGDGPEATEYARLIGERDALERAVIMKKCDSGIIPERVNPEEKIKDAKTDNTNIDDEV